MFRLACGLYDQLEIFSMRKTEVKILYINDDGQEFEDEGLITDIIAKDGVEQIIFNSKIYIKTQDIIKINSLDFR